MVLLVLNKWKILEFESFFFSYKHFFLMVFLIGDFYKRRNIGIVSFRTSRILLCRFYIPSKLLELFQVALTLFTPCWIFLYSNSNLLVTMKFHSIKHDIKQFKICVTYTSLFQTTLNNILNHWSQQQFSDFFISLFPQKPILFI